MRIGIIGGGTVGRATARMFLGHGNHEVRVFDTNPMRATHPRDELLAYSQVVFVCLPTPQEAGRLACDTTLVETFLSDRENGAHKDLVYAIRSTVPVGFCRTMSERYRLPQIAHFPEFLTARVAETDAQLPARCVIGSVDKPSTSGAAALLLGLCRERFPGTPLHIMSSEESEMVKLVQNSYSACKIAFFNEVRTFADKRGLDWDRVLKAVIGGGWIEPLHTQVPGPDGKFGFGGTCLPKDLANLVSCLEDDHLPAFVMRAAMTRNEFDRGRNS